VAQSIKQANDFQWMQWKLAQRCLIAQRCWKLQNCIHAARPLWRIRVSLDSSRFAFIANSQSPVLFWDAIPSHHWIAELLLYIPSVLDDCKLGLYMPQRRQTGSRAYFHRLITLTGSHMSNMARFLLLRTDRHAYTYRCCCCCTAWRLALSALICRAEQDRNRPTAIIE